MASFAACQIARRTRDRLGLHTNRIDVYELIYEEGEGKAL